MVLGKKVNLKKEGDAGVVGEMVVSISKRGLDRQGSTSLKNHNRLEERERLSRLS